MKTRTMTVTGLFFFAALGAILFAQDGGQSGGQSNVQGVDFKFAPGKSRLEITLDKNATFDKEVSAENNQVILNIKNAQVAGNLTRKLDTSSFTSNVALISPYQNGADTRIVLQLKQAGDVNVTQEGNMIVATIDNKDGGATADAVATATPPAATPPAPGTPNAPTEAAPVTAPSDANVAAAAVNAGVPVATTPSPSETGPIPGATGTDPNPTPTSLDSFFNAQQTRNYQGKKIVLQLQNADIQDVFRVIGEASEFNIVVGEDVKGKISLNLVDVPWDQALDLVLKTNKLSAERNGNVLRIMTTSNLTAEKQAEIQARQASEAVEPIVVKIFPVSYAKIEEIKKIIDDFLSKDYGAGGGGVPGGNSSTPKRGSIQIDTRTNSLIVRDTPTGIEKIKRIMKELDVQTPQILIEAKFVEVKENYQSDVEGRIWSTSREFDPVSNQLLFQPTNNNFGALFGGAAFGAAGSLPAAFAMSPVQGASFGFSPKAGIIPGLSEIAAFLSILEAESSAKVIASPRVVTQNKEQAEITQGNTIELPSNAGANAAGTFLTVQAVLRLQVVPQVTNEGTITLKLTFSQDTPSAQQLSTAGSLSLDTKSINTTVLVDSGATLVIGGIYSYTYNESSAGIPFLRDIPILGAFFGSRSKSTVKDELFIFLTPRVLNEKETGVRT